MWHVFLAILIASPLLVSSASGENIKGGWEKIIESDGIIGYSRPTSKSGVYEIKAVGSVDASVAVLESVLRDDPAKTEYSQSCIEAFKVDLPGLESTKDTYYSYHMIDMPWPFYDRDGVAKVECKVDKKTGAFIMQARSIATDFMAHDYFVLRVSIVKAKWVLTPMGENKTLALYQILADPGGYVPTALVNMYSEDLAVMTIAALRKMVKKDDYKNAEAIVTTTPWVR
jgi:hypothetical protein